MYTTLFVCVTCGNPAIARANERFFHILNGKANDEEVFALLGISTYYSSYIKNKKNLVDRDAFTKAVPIGTVGTLKYRDFLQAKERKYEAPDAYRILNIDRLCCMRCVFSPPVWPNYNTTIPPNSGIELDTGQVQRYSIRRGMNFDIGEIGEDEYVETGGQIIEEVDLTVTEQELAQLLV
jgi:DNA-directed RNA polymerase subunit N (RpoN/RPB10)